MKPEKYGLKALSITQAEFLERLLFRSQVSEKIVFVLAFGFFCFLAGFGTAKIYLDKQNAKENLAINIYQNKTNKKTTSLPEEINNTKDNDESGSQLLPENKRSPASEEFYFTIRVGSAADKLEAEELIKKYQTECPDVNYKFSEIHRRYLLYCGRFDDIFSAKAVMEKLNTDEHIIVRKISNDFK